MWQPGPVLVAGPCVLEDDRLNLQVAEALADLAARLGLRVIYKASFAKANRTRRDAARGPGLERGLAMLDRVKRESGLPVLTDVHETTQVAAVAAVADALQVPAFLSRQTELLETVGRAGKPVNLKKGQWMAPETMAAAVEKVTAVGNTVVAVTERGTAFGYRDLLVDMRNFTLLSELTGMPVLFDATHAVQRPALGRRGATGGDRRHVPPLLKAAAAAGAHGFFVETHPMPERAPSDGATMWPLDRLAPLIEETLAVWSRCREGGTLRA